MSTSTPKSLTRGESPPPPAPTCVARPNALGWILWAPLRGEGDPPPWAGGGGVPQDGVPRRGARDEPSLREEWESGWGRVPSNHSSLVAMASGATTSKQEGWGAPPNVLTPGIRSSLGARCERRPEDPGTARASRTRGEHPVGFRQGGQARGGTRLGKPPGWGRGPGGIPGTRFGGRDAPPGWLF